MQRERLQQIQSLALPILGALASQNLLNLADTAIVGHLGADALAAVGVGSFLNFLTAALVMGVSSGVQAMAARRCGEGREDVSAVPLNGGLIFVVALAVPLTLLAWWVAPIVFPLLQKDPDVVAEGVPYLRTRLLGVAAVGANFAFRGFFNGIGASAVYMRTLVTMHLIDLLASVVLTYGLLGAPELGAVGAGLGTSIGLWCGTAIYFGQAVRLARGRGFLAGVPDRTTLRTMLTLAVPSSVQQVFFAASFTVLFWIIGQIGTTELAAANLLITLTLVALLPGMGIGMATATLVGRALGRGEPDDARRWGWEGAQVGLVVAGAIGLLLAAAPGLVARGFISDADAIEAARWPLVVTGLLIGVDVFGVVLMAALQGAGDSRTPMVASLSLQWLLCLPAAWLVGPQLGGGLMAVWAVFTAQRALQSLWMAHTWRAGRWVHAKA